MCCIICGKILCKVQSKKKKCFQIMFFAISFTFGACDDRCEDGVVALIASSKPIGDDANRIKSDKVASVDPCNAWLLCCWLLFCGSAEPWLTCLFTWSLLLSLSGTFWLHSITWNGQTNNKINKLLIILEFLL